MQLHIFAAAEVDALIVIVHGHGQGDLRPLLSDDVLIQHLFDLLGRREVLHTVEALADRRTVSVVQNGHTELHALVADPHARPLDHPVYLSLRLAAERAAQGLSLICHAVTSYK